MCHNLCEFTEQEIVHSYSDQDGTHNVKGIAKFQLLSEVAENIIV